MTMTMTPETRQTPDGPVKILSQKQRDALRRSLDKNQIKLRSYQREFMADQSRFRLNMWSRQTGKSFTSALDDVLTSEETGYGTMQLSASADLTKELMLKTAYHAEWVAGVSGEMQREVLAGAMDETLYVDEDKVKITQTTITMPDGIRLIGRPANPRTARGFSMHVNLDEFSMHEKSEEIYGAAFFSITSNEALRCKVQFTPKGKKGKAYQLATDENNGYSKRIVTIYDAVKAGLDIDPEVLRKAIGDDEIWQQEALCVFVDEATAFLTYDQISSCQHEGLRVIRRIEAEGGAVGASEEDIAAALKLDRLIDLATLQGGDLYLGVDVGRRKDLTVFWLWEKVGLVYWARAIIELSKVPFRHQEALGLTLIGELGIKRACIDETGIGMMLAENLAFKLGTHKVEAVGFGKSDVKQSLAEPFKTKIDDHKCRYPADNLIREDFHNITKIVMPSGAVRYLGEKSDGHGVIHPDRFWAAALGIQAAESTPYKPFEQYIPAGGEPDAARRQFGRVQGVMV